MQPCQAVVSQAQALSLALFLALGGGLHLGCSGGLGCSPFDAGCWAFGVRIGGHGPLPSGLGPSVKGYPSRWGFGMEGASHGSCQWPPPMRALANWPMGCPPYPTPPLSSQHPTVLLPLDGALRPVQGLPLKPLPSMAISGPVPLCWCPQRVSHRRGGGRGQAEEDGRAMAGMKGWGWGGGLQQGEGHGQAMGQHGSVVCCSQGAWP